MKCFILAEFHNMNIHIKGPTFQSVQSLTLSHDEGIDHFKKWQKPSIKKAGFCVDLYLIKSLPRSTTSSGKTLATRLVEGKRSSPC